MPVILEDHTENLFHLLKLDVDQAGEPDRVAQELLERPWLEDAEVRDLARHAGVDHMVAELPLDQLALAVAHLRLGGGGQPEDDDLLLGLLGVADGEVDLELTLDQEVVHLVDDDDLVRVHREVLATWTYVLHSGAAAEQRDDGALGRLVAPQELVVRENDPELSLVVVTAEDVDQRRGDPALAVTGRHRNDLLGAAGAEALEDAGDDGSLVVVDGEAAVLEVLAAICDGGEDGIPHVDVHVGEALLHGGGIVVLEPVFRRLQLAHEVVVLLAFFLLEVHFFPSELALLDF